MNWIEPSSSTCSFFSKSFESFYLPAKLLLFGAFSVGLLLLSCPLTIWIFMSLMTWFSWLGRVALPVYECLKTWPEVFAAFLL